MITTADWLRYIESLGPSDDTDALRARIESAGADPQYAEWLLKLVRGRRMAQAFARAGVTTIAVGIGLSAYQWWLALTGSPKAPDGASIGFVALILAIGAIMTVISSANEISPPLDFSQRSIPSDLPPPPRQVSLSSRTSAVRRLALGILCFMLAPLALSVSDVRDRVWLRQRGLETTGHVTTKFVRKGSKGSVNYYIGYSFDRGSGIQSVRRSRFDAIHEGDIVPVTYLPDRPEINRAITKAQLGSWFSTVDDPVLLIVAVYFIVLLPIVALLAGYGLSRQRVLAERGVAVMAEVTRARQGRIEYRFGDQQGRYVWGKRRVRERPAVGQPLVILYDPEKPRRSVPLGALGDLEFR